MLLPLKKNVKKIFYFYLAVFGNRSIDNRAVAAVDDVVVDSVVAVGDVVHVGTAEKET